MTCLWVVTMEVVTREAAHLKEMKLEVHWLPTHLKPRMTQTLDTFKTCRVTVNLLHSMLMHLHRLLRELSG